MLNIIEIIFSMQVHGFIAAPVDLPPASDALRYGETCTLPGLITFHKIWHFRAWSNQAHIAAYHVEYLGKFIQ